jgi:hypothetical protein
MSLDPRQLNQLHDDVNRVYFQYFLPIYGGDTGPWIVADSGGASAPAVEAARLKVYADAHGTAHRLDGRMREIAIRLALMGKATSASVDTGTP